MKEMCLSKDSDVALFLKYASMLEEIGAYFTEKITGPDQRYWDFLFANEQFTLHQEHYLGISIMSEKELPDSFTSLTEEK